MKTLLIAPKYFNYDKLICSELVSLGHSVDLFPDRPADTTLVKAATRLNRQLTFPVADRFFFSKLADRPLGYYDYILVFQGEGLSTKVLKWLRDRNPKAAMLLYMWDSFRNKPGLTENIKFFKSVATFDSLDANKFGLYFRPLFFSPHYEMEIGGEFDFDVSFIGTAHDDRPRVVKLLRDGMGSDVRFFRFLYIQSYLLYVWRKLADPKFRKVQLDELSFSKMNQSAVAEVINRSLAVLDVQHSAQQGLTMRTLEVLGARRKLITTNADVVNYDFYRPENILVVDRDHPVVPRSFIDSEYEELPACIYEKYSLRGFLKELLELSEKG